MISCVFGTGTGRCGSVLLTTILNCFEKVHCEHERSVDTLEMKRAYRKQNNKLLLKSTNKILVPTVRKYNDQGVIYGEINPHLYFLFPELYRRFENTCRFILLVRSPDTFIRSALARGYFSPNHPNGLEHLIPPENTEIGMRWKNISPFEKCAWYWALVNGFVYRFFKTIPDSQYRIIKLEKIDIEVLENIHNFLLLSDFYRIQRNVKNVLKKKYNSSPNGGKADSFNPYSEEISLGGIETWDEDQLNSFNRHVFPLYSILYK
jgi:hypothetical protein